MTEYIAPAYEPERFFHDLRRTAEAIAAPFDDTKVRETLDVFDAALHRSIFQLKTTSKTDSRLYYRFLSKRKNDPIGNDLIDIAQRQGLLRLGNASVALHREVLDKYPGTAGLMGLDVDTGFGLAKSWTFTGARPIEELFDLPAVPDAVRAHADFFARHGLCRVFFVASDYQSETMNLYAIVEPDRRNTDWLRRLVEDTGGTSEDTPGYPQMIASLAVTASLGMTFSWNGPEMHRWALYGLNVPYRDTQASAALPTLPPRLQTFLDQASTLNLSPLIDVGWSFGKAGFYTKLAVGGPEFLDQGGVPRRRNFI